MNSSDEEYHDMCRRLSRAVNLSHLETLDKLDKSFRESVEDFNRLSNLDQGDLEQLGRLVESYEEKSNKWRTRFVAWDTSGGEPTPAVTGPADTASERWSDSSRDLEDLSATLSGIVREAVAGRDKMNQRQIQWDLGPSRRELDSFLKKQFGVRSQRYVQAEYDLARSHPHVPLFSDRESQKSCALKGAFERWEEERSQALLISGVILDSEIKDLRKWCAAESRHLRMQGAFNMVASYFYGSYPHASAEPAIIGMLKALIAQLVFSLGWVGIDRRATYGLGEAAKSAEGLVIWMRKFIRGIPFEDRNHQLGYPLSICLFIDLCKLPADQKVQGDMGSTLEGLRDIKIDDSDVSPTGRKKFFKLLVVTKAIPREYIPSYLSTELLDLSSWSGGG